jgi:Rrf2 family protein
MKLSTKGRYGTRVLLDLALRCGEGPIPLKDITQRQRIPLPYLEHLISPLKAARTIKSSRGARGGIWLVKPPQEVRLNEVISLEDIHLVILTHEHFDHIGATTFFGTAVIAARSLVASMIELRDESVTRNENRNIPSKPFYSHLWRRMEY